MYYGRCGSGECGNRMRKGKLSGGNGSFFTPLIADASRLAEKSKPVLHFCFTDIESGTTKDYIYGHLNVKYTFSVELRDKGKDGFLLPKQMIEPTAREAFEGVKAMILNIELNDLSFT